MNNQLDCPTTYTRTSGLGQVGVYLYVCLVQPSVIMPTCTIACILITTQQEIPTLTYIPVRQARSSNATLTSGGVCLP